MKKPKFSIVAAICMLLVCAIVTGCVAAGPTSGQQNLESNPPVTTPTSTPPQPTEPAIPQIVMQAYADRIYTSPNYEGRYNYTLRLSEDHTFQMTGSPYLSTFMLGFWTQEEDELVLYGNSGKVYFQITESGFTFLRSRSDIGHMIQDLAEGALFAERLPAHEDIIATYYETNATGTGEPIRLMLGSISGYEGQQGYYSFGNSTINGMEGKGEWEIQDDLLILYEPKNGNYLEKQYLYFQITGDGFVFLPDRSDRWPLEENWPDDGVLIRQTEENKLIVAELYTFQPAGSLHKFQLHLFDGFYYYLMSSAGGLEEGVCYTEGDMLILTKQIYYNNVRYRFRITEEGYVFQDEGSGDPNFFTKLEDQALFTADQPEWDPTIGAYYTLQTEGVSFPARLFLSYQNHFEFYGPDYSNQLYGEWSQENGILTITARGEDDNSYRLTFRIEKDGVCFLAAQSDPVPEEYGLTDGVRFDLVKPGEAAPPATTPPEETTPPPPPPTAPPPTTEPTVRPTCPPVEGDIYWGMYDGKFCSRITEDRTYVLDLYSDGTFKHRVSTVRDYEDYGIWNLEGDLLYLIGLDADGNENGYISCFQYIPRQADESGHLVFIKGSHDLPNLSQTEDGAIYGEFGFILIP